MTFVQCKHPIYLILLSLSLSACNGEPSIESSSSPDIESGDMPPSVDATDSSVPRELPCETDDDCGPIWSDLGTCERARCISSTDGGSCVRITLSNGEPCNDLDACTQEETCTVSGCVAGKESNCSAGLCQGWYGCDEYGDCLYEQLEDGSLCDDGNSCTVGDLCVSGICTGSYEPGADGCSCTRDSDCPIPADACDGTASCQNGACTMVPVGGIQCDPTDAGPCESITCIDGQCVAITLPASSPCDDGNPCSTDDTCTLNGCIGASNVCTCTVDSDCSSYEDGDLCNGILSCSDGLCVVDPSTKKSCPESDEPCLVSVCQPSTGLCTSTPRPDYVDCNDGDACTLGEHCVQGQCVSTAPASCGPPTLCGDSPCDSVCLAVSSCDTGVGCSSDASLYLEGIPCDDGLACNVSDTCFGGICTPGMDILICDDGNPCTGDLCDESLGCLATPLESACDDGDPCTYEDQCVDGSCVGTYPLECPTEDECTTGFCVAGQGCEYVFNTSPCEDGDPCTVGDVCQSGQCKPGDKVCPCNEDANCTVTGGGECAGVWHCINNQCVLETTAAVLCPAPDGPCQTSFCDIATGNCISGNALDGSLCDDGDACTPSSLCIQGSCVGSQPISCDDDNPCTEDVCDPSAGCTHSPLPLPCDDGDSCTQVDTCINGECIGSVSICECLADTDCPQPTNKCDGVARCIGNQCIPPTDSVICSGSGLGPCLEAQCLPSTGACVVVSKLNGSDCSAVGLCAVGGVCVDSMCVGSVNIDCDDGEVCTIDSCSPGDGCIHTPIAGPCNDGDPCTSDDECINGACISTASVCQEECADELDNDSDGLTDCSDPDCIGSAACGACGTAPVIQCADAIVPGAVGDGAVSNVGSTACGPGPLGDRVYRFTSNQGGPVAFTLIDGQEFNSLRVLTATQDGGCDSTSCKAVGAEAVFDAVPGQLYFLVIERLLLGAPPGFVLSVTCGTPCQPACDGKQCGPDGCGGACGTCLSTTPCETSICDGLQCVESTIPDCCLDSDECDNGLPCTTGTCVSNSCEFSAVIGCCAGDSDCDDGVECTVDLCDSGVCANDPVGDDCCLNDAECDDGLGCTVDACALGTCVAIPVPGCCALAADCPPPPPCFVSTCESGLCELAAVPGCCLNATECDDGDSCTFDGCNPATLSCIYAPLPGCCDSLSDCEDDNDPCTQLACVSGKCVQSQVATCCAYDSDCPSAGPCSLGQCIAGTCFTQPKPGCCVADTDCSNDSPCDQTSCVQNECTSVPIIGCCTAALDCPLESPCDIAECLDGVCSMSALENCCEVDGDCDDGNECTKEMCTGGVCTSTEIPGCCGSAFDCVGGTCVSPECIGSQCLWTPIPGCCVDSSQCSVGDPCIEASCVAGQCQLSPIFGCCVDDSECVAPDDPCVSAYCDNGTCDSKAIEGCCYENMDCPTSELPCTEAHCLGHACVVEEVSGCCNDVSDCLSSNNPCVKVECVDGYCSAQEIEDCCSTASDCVGASGACQQVDCLGNACVESATPGCCQTDEDCSGYGGTCDLAECVLGECRVSAQVPGCCSTLTDCPVSTDPCRERDCVAGQCVLQLLPGCCEDATDCPAGGDCLVSGCTDGYCNITAVPGCCISAADCADDGNPCTATLCTSGTCQHEQVEGCCSLDWQCADAFLDAGPCDESVCTNGQCTLQVASGCCQSDSDCSVGPCELGVCENYTCINTPSPGCCTMDVDCAEDDDPCTVASCVDGKCGWYASPGCCVDNVDCQSGGDPCLIPVCENSTCSAQAITGCGLSTCMYLGMETDEVLQTQLSSSSAQLQFIGQSNTVFQGNSALEASFGPGLVEQWASIILPPFNASGPAHLRFRYRLEVGNGDCSAGRLRVVVDGTVTWEVCTKTGGWKSAMIPMDLDPGATPTIQIRLDSGAGLTSGTAVIDDLAISGECELLCDSGVCDDGDPCTQDTCSGGLCLSLVDPTCCVSDLSCQDGDPCTQDSCTSSGCKHEPISGCNLGACFHESFDGLPLGGDSAPTESGVTAQIVDHLDSQWLYLGPALDAPLGASGIWNITLPPILSSGLSLTLRGRYESTLAGCQFGSLSVVPSSDSIPLQVDVCSGSGSFAVDIPAEAVDALNPEQLSLQFKTNGTQGTLLLDDLRLDGICRTVECAAASDCPSKPCHIAACDVAYRCEYTEISNCCDVNDDCEPLPCDTAACVDGLCQSQPDPGPCGAACFQASSDVNVTITTNDDATASWTDGPAAGTVLGSWNTPMGAPASADWNVGTVRVWGKQSTFRFRYDAQMSPGCDSGALELRIDGILVWQACDSASAEWVEMPISADSGVETRTLEFRLRGGVTGSGSVAIDAVTVLGTCQEVQCTMAVDCDDGSACTDDSCIGYECVHLSNQSACSDGNACTTGDTCLGGECVAKAVDCNDNNPCTDDACEPSSGCVFIPNVTGCDDGEPCTAGDSCVGGACVGTPVVCKDLSDCTIDGCTPGVGCQFQLQPFGAECNDGGIVQGSCVEGICIEWEQSQFPSDSYISSMSERSGPLPLRAAGSLSGVATVWDLDQATAAPSESTSTQNLSAWRSTGGGYLAGDNGALASIIAPSSLIDVSAISSLPLHDVAVSGQLLFTAGDGYAHGQVTSTVRRCKLADGSINGCQVMPVVKSPEQCGSQVPFHVRAITVVSSQSVLFAGTAISGLDAAAVVAEWNGNTNDACDALGIYSGEVYSTGGATLRVNTLGLGRKESFQALGQSNDGTVWTAGTGGMIYRRQDGIWYGFNPADWPAGTGFHGGYEVRDLHAGQDQVFFVGDGVGLMEPGCQRGFLLRAVRVGQHWWVDHMNRFSWLKACGPNASDALGLQDVIVDGLTEDLLIGGHATVDGTSAGLVLRLRAPGI